MLAPWILTYVKPRICLFDDGCELFKWPHCKRRVCVCVYVMEVRSERAEWGCLAGGRRYNVPLQLAQLRPPRSPVRHIAFTFPTTRMDVNSIRSGQSFGPLGIPSNPLFRAQIFRNLSLEILVDSIHNFFSVQSSKHAQSSVLVPICRVTSSECVSLTDNTQHFQFGGEQV